MKKFFVVALVFAVAVALVAAMGCTNTPAGPDTGATETAVANANASATASAIAVATASTTIMDFASTVQGWYIPDPQWTTNDALTGPTAHDAVNGNTNTASSAGCITVVGEYDASVNAQHQAGDFEYAFAANTNMTGKRISLWIKVPTAMATNGTYHAAIYIKNGSDYGYSYNNGGDQIITTDGWVNLKWDCAIGGNVDATDLQNIAMIGINLYRPDALVANDLTSQTVLVDDVKIDLAGY